MTDLQPDIVGALRLQIQAHGPIDDRWIGSAAKRIIGAIQEGRRRDWENAAKGEDVKHEEV